MGLWRGWMAAIRGEMPPRNTPDFQDQALRSACILSINGANMVEINLRLKLSQTNDPKVESMVIGQLVGENTNKSAMLPII